MLFTTLENSALTSGLVKEHQVVHSSSPSLINSNYYKPFKARAVLENIVLRVGSQGLIQHSCCMSFSTPPLHYISCIAFSPVFYIYIYVLYNYI